MPSENVLISALTNLIMSIDRAPNIGGLLTIHSSKTQLEEALLSRVGKMRDGLCQAELTVPKRG